MASYYDRIITPANAAAIYGLIYTTLNKQIEMDRSSSLRIDTQKVIKLNQEEIGLEMLCQETLFYRALYYWKPDQLAEKYCDFGEIQASGCGQRQIQGKD